MATTTKVRVKNPKLVNSTISTVYGRFKFDSNGTCLVPIELARELLSDNKGFTVVDDDGNEIEFIEPEPEPTIPGGGDDTITPEPTISGGDDTITPEPTISGGDDTITPEPTIPGGGDDTITPEPTIPGGGDDTITPEPTIPGGGDDTITPEPTIPGGGDDTIEPEPTIPGGDDTIEPEPTEQPVVSFSYDFDGKTFTVSGGLNFDITEDDLNEKAGFDGNSLSMGEGIVDDINEVHVTGLQENSSVIIDGEEFVLQDIDNNPENGLELLGETTDAYGWKFTNRISGKYEPQVWKHYTDEKEDVIVIGCTGRPHLEDNILKFNGDDIKVISNGTDNTLIIESAALKGKLTKGITWDATIGIKSGLGTVSHILTNGTLYVPKARISSITSDTVEYTLSKGTMTITSGTINISQASIKGSSISAIRYNNKTYYVNINSGKLVPNAWQKRKG